MKLASLIIKYRDGEVEAIGAESVVDLINGAKAISASGVHEGHAVDEGVVLCTWKNGPAFKFHCKPGAVPPVQDGTEQPAKRGPGRPRKYAPAE